MTSLIPIFPLMLLILLAATFNHFGEARVIVVGGSLDAWKVPESSNDSLNHWAGTARFQVGDTLWWKYDSEIDSVLQVTKENYEKCNTEKPLKEYKDGNTTVTLSVSGPYYFISGAPTGNCAKGEKITVVVQSPNHPAMPKPGPGPAPPTSPAASAPAPAPAKSTAVGLVAGNGIFWLFLLSLALLHF